MLKEMKGILGRDKLRKHRNEVCFSQEYMAKQLGITQSTYQRIESGEIKISMARLIQIATILDKPLEALLGIKKIKTNQTHPIKP